MPVVGFAYRPIERLVVDVEHARAMMATGPCRGVPARHQRIEEVAHLAAVRNAGEGAILPTHADAGMQHDGHQKRRLAIGEPVEPNLGDSLTPRHRKSSSAVCGSNGGLPPSALAPPTRPADPRNRVKPAATFPDACRPR